MIDKDHSLFVTESLKDERSNSRGLQGGSSKVQAEGEQAVQEQGSQSWTEGVSPTKFFPSHALPLIHLVICISKP